MTASRPRKGPALDLAALHAHIEALARRRDELCAAWGLDPDRGVLRADVATAAEKEKADHARQFQLVVEQLATLSLLDLMAAKSALDSMRLADYVRSVDAATRSLERIDFIVYLRENVGLDIGELAPHLRGWLADKVSGGRARAEDATAHRQPEWEKWNRLDAEQRAANPELTTLRSRAAAVATALGDPRKAEAIRKRLPKLGRTVGR